MGSAKQEFQINTFNNCLLGDQSSSSAAGNFNNLITKKGPLFCELVRLKFPGEKNNTKIRPQFKFFHRKLKLEQKNTINK